jgi:hypothetical protein
VRNTRHAYLVQQHGRAALHVRGLLALRAAVRAYLQWVYNPSWVFSIRFSRFWRCVLRMWFYALWAHWGALGPHRRRGAAPAADNKCNLPVMETLPEFNAAGVLNGIQV